MVFAGMGGGGAEAFPSVWLEWWWFVWKSSILLGFPMSGWLAGEGRISRDFLFVPVAISGLPASPALYPEYMREFATVSCLIAWLVCLSSSLHRSESYIGFIYNFQGY